jgi:hypothetical protein
MYIADIVTVAAKNAITRAPVCRQPGAVGENAREASQVQPWGSPGKGTFTKRANKMLRTEAIITLAGNCRDGEK